jgi:hypothetical protein
MICEERALDAVTALARFEKGLERAKALARGNTSPVPMPRGMTPARWSQETLLAAVCDLMKDTGLERFLPLPHRMMEALENLNRGLTDDLVRPADRHEQRILIDDARTMVRAIRAVDMLMARDNPRRLNRQEAARLVYKRMAWSGLVKSPDAIIELRKNVRRRRANRDVMQIYHTPFPPEAGETTAERAAWLLTTLREEWSNRR